MRADLELETETVLFQQKGLERFVVRGDDVFVAVGEELRSLRFDGGPSSLVASMPGESVSDLAVQGNAYNTTGGTLSVTLYKAAEGTSPVFNLTSLSARVLDNTAQGYDADPAHSFAVARRPTSSSSLGRGSRS